MRTGAGQGGVKHDEFAHLKKSLKLTPPLPASSDPTGSTCGGTARCSPRRPPRATSPWRSSATRQVRQISTYLSMHQHTATLFASTRRSHLFSTSLPSSHPRATPPPRPHAGQLRRGLLQRRAARAALHRAPHAGPGAVPVQPCQHAAGPVAQVRGSAILVGSSLMNPYGISHEVSMKSHQVFNQPTTILLPLAGCPA